MAATVYLITARVDFAKILVLDLNSKTWIGLDLDRNWTASVEAVAETGLSVDSSVRAPDWFATVAEPDSIVAWPVG